MVKRTALDTNPCPIARSLDAIGDWWSLLILRDALAGISRFGEFQKSLGLARNILAARLKSLVAEGVLEMAPAGDGSAHQAYRPTEKGRALLPVLVALRQWGEDWRYGDAACPNMLVDRKKGEEIRRLELRAADGRVLGPGEVRVAPRAGAHG